MLATTSVDRSKTYATPTSLTSILVGLILVYQVVNYVFLKTALDGLTSDFNSELEASCAADPGLADGSSLCIEAQLFRGWHQMPGDAPESLEKLLEITPSSRNGEQPMLQPSTSAIPVPPQTDSKSKLPTNMEATDKFVLPQVHSSNFTHDLVELQQRLDAKNQERANRHAQHRALRALHDVALRGDGKETATTTQDSMTSWAHKVDDLTHDIQHHMEARRKEREEHLAARAAMHNARLAHLQAAVQAEAPPSPTAALLARADDRLKEYHSFMDEVQAVGRDLCQDTRRHDLPACAQFIKAKAMQNRSDESVDLHEEVKAHHEANVAMMAHMHLLEKHLVDLEHSHDHEATAIKAESEHFLKELCADPARSSYPTCAQYINASVASASHSRGHPDIGASSTPAEKHGKKFLASTQVPSLSWESMQDWVTKHSSELYHDAHDRTPLMFHRQDERLRGQWKGKAPVVACITVLPQGQVTETLMKTFMDNYNSQEYEGDRKLVIVYHQDDEKAKDIAQPYVNGKSIIAAAAFGEGRFISSTAYRYGGWLARDAEITAQWDFDAWHHPLQLSMQVRAMAISGRPSSVVTWVTDFNADGTKSNAIQGGSGQHGSMVGETSWMRKNWMPLIEEEQSVPTGFHAREVVQVDMPELLAYHDMKAHAQFLRP